MNNGQSLQKIDSQHVAVWQDEEKIRKLFAKDLSPDEFRFFVSLGASLGANPFTREIWAVKYNKNQPASIFCGRDFYRRKAQELPEYDGHLVDAVYERDEFAVEDGKVHHKYSLGNRGKLLGAYCIVYKKGIRQPYYVFVPFNEYNRGFSNWKNMPETMIKKVAEAQGLRGAFQGTFKGTYDESEMWEIVPETQSEQPESQDTENTTQNTGKPKKVAQNRYEGAGKPKIKQESNKNRLVKRYNELCEEANSLGVDFKKVDITKVTENELIDIGKDLKKKIDAAKSEAHKKAELLREFAKLKFNLQTYGVPENAILQMTADDSIEAIESAVASLREQLEQKKKEKQQAEENIFENI